MAGFRYRLGVPSEDSWHLYPAGVPAADREHCCTPGCDLPGDVVLVHTGSTLLPFGNQATATTVWCFDHARAKGYQPPVAGAMPSRPRLNAFQRWIVRQLGGAEASPD